uniref:Uncharacterized protein n=1 Tax=Sphaerodactylus townsendi TaxID=933632 RepID=A0ACB8GAN3_9SAUR
MKIIGIKGTVGCDYARSSFDDDEKAVISTKATEMEISMKLKQVSGSDLAHCSNAERAERDVDVTRTEVTKGI